MPKEKEYMKFGDMPEGTHFKEAHRRKARKFIKLRHTLPSGLSQKIGRVVQNEDGTESELLTFNSVDYDGVGGSCPDWKEFEVIKLGEYRVRKLPPKVMENLEKLRS